MNFLVIHQNYPGQFGLIAEALAKSPENRVIGIGDYQNLKGKKFNSGYTVYSYVSRKLSAAASHHYLTSFERAIRRGQDVVRACQDLRAKGFVPDVVLGHPGWGELLFIKDAFPNARVVSYFEYFYRFEGGDLGFDPEFPAAEDAKYRLRIRNSTQLHALNDSDAGYTPTQWQLSTYPAQYQGKISLIHDGFDLQRYVTNPQARFDLGGGKHLDRSDSVITFVSRNLEPYRGFHAYMRALPGLQKRLPQTQFVIVGGDSVSYGNMPEKHKSWKEQMLAEVGDQLDLSRIHFVGKVPYQQYLDLLQISKLHIYLTYPFVLSWSLLEAMASGVPVLASATTPVMEVIEEGRNGYLFNFFDTEQLVERAVQLLACSHEEQINTAKKMIEEKFSFNNNVLENMSELLFG